VKSVEVSEIKVLEARVLHLASVMSHTASMSHNILTPELYYCTTEIDPPKAVELKEL